jgi:hypothetical protein
MFEVVKRELACHAPQGHEQSQGGGYEYHDGEKLGGKCNPMNNVSVGVEARVTQAQADGA